MVEESRIASSAQIGLVLNRVHFAAPQILHHDCTVRMLALEMLRVMERHRQSILDELEKAK